MTKFNSLLAVVVASVAGCAATPPLASTKATPHSTAPDASPSQVELADYQAPAPSSPTPELVQPPAVEQSPAEPRRLPAAEALTLEDLMQMAMASNPAIAQSAARVRALRGKWVQSGLLPNPTLGYSSGEVGDDGTAGQQGGYLGQRIITAGKLPRRRAVVSAEITRAQQRMAAVEMRVRTDVRQSYYAALLAQRRVELAEELVRLATEAADASQALLDAEEIPLPGLLQTEIQQQNAIVVLRTAQNTRERAWRTLTAVVGGPELPVQPLAGDVSRLPEALGWEEQLARIQSQSPEIAAAMAEVERARRALQLACAEAYPDVSTQFTVQFNDSTNETIAGVQVGAPLPIWDRNQGGIRQARAEVSEAMRNVERLERNLNQRLANAFREYADARVTAENYRSDVLPRAQRTFELVQQGYRQGETGYLDLLAAQRTFSQTNLSYLDALGSLWQSYVRIDGLLLEGSLDEPTP